MQHISDLLHSKIALKFKLNPSIIHTNLLSRNWGNDKSFNYTDFLCSFVRLPLVPSS